MPPAARGREAKGGVGVAKDYHHGDLRAALLLAAEAELAERGVEGFTLRGCARRAGVSHAAPAHHFGDGGGLLTALAAEGFARFTAALEARLAARGAQGRTALEAAGLGYLDFARANEGLFRLMFASSRPEFADARLHREAEAAFALLVRTVEEERGAPPFADPAGPADVAATWAIAHGLADLLLSGRLRFLGAAQAGEAADAALAAVLARLRLGG